VEGDDGIASVTTTSSENLRTQAAGHWRACAGKNPGMGSEERLYEEEDDGRVWCVGLEKSFLEETETRLE
jgi:hypothetical protein